MASSSSVNLKALGLNFSPNALELPPGSLIEADNIIIRRDDVIESRRGFKLYGNEIPNQQSAKQLMAYRDRILRHYGSKLAFQDGELNDGTVKFTEFDGSYTEPEFGLRMKWVQEKNGNFYFTSNEGIKKISAADGSELNPSAGYITQAGGIKALDLSADFRLPTSSEEGFLPENSVVAYKLVWGKTDANNVEILGSPSEEVVVYNPLRTLLVLNLNNLLYILDKFSNSNALFKADSTKVLFSTLAGKLSITAAELRQKLIDLATKLDKDEVFANDNGAGTSYAPMNISSTTVANGIITIPFSAGTPSNYFSTDITSPKNLKIYLDGFKSNNVDIDGLNGAQEIQSVSDSPAQITFTARNYTAATSDGISGGIVDIPATSPVSTALNNTNLVSSDIFTYPNISGKTSATSGDYTIESNGHNLVDGDIVKSNTTAGGFTSGQEYYVINSVKAVSFQLSETVGGVAVTTTTSATVSFISKFIFNERVLVKFSSTGTYPRYSGLIFTINTPTNSVFNCAGHPFQNNDTVILNSVGGSLPSPFSATTTYYVKYLTSSTFQLATTSNGSAVQYTNSGSGTFYVTKSTNVIDPTKYYCARTTTAGYTFQLSESADSSILDFTYAGTGTLNATKIVEVAITTSIHGLKDGQYVVISNSSCYPSIDNTITTPYAITVLSDTKFSIKTEKEIQKSGASGQWNIVVDTIGEIQSNKYRLIEQPVEPDATDLVGTGKVLFEQQKYLNSIITTLTSENTNVVNSSAANTLGLTNFTQQTSGVVDLQFTVPKEIDSSYYYQLYRTTNRQIGSTDVTSLEQALPNQDFKLILQEYYSSAEAPNGYISITDVVQEAFLTGAQLYTNTGEARNDYPPLSKDIASFKGITFYSNAKLKQQILLELIGVKQFKDKLDAGITPKLLFTDTTGNNTCEVNFVLAKKQVSLITTVPAPASTAVYFDLFSVNNKHKYRFWYGGSAPSSLTGGELVEINMSGTITLSERVQRVVNTVNLYLLYFQADGYNTSFAASSGLATITCSNSFTNGDKIQFIGNYLPDGIGEDIEYYVKNVTVSNFEVSLTLNGPSIACSTSGIGFVKVITSTQKNDKIVITNADDGGADLISSSSLTLTVSTAILGVGENVTTKTASIPSSNLLDPATQAELTIKSLIRIINRNTIKTINNTFDLYAYYVDSPALFLLEGRVFKDDTFYPLANSPEIGSAFSPDISPSTVNGTIISTSVLAANPITLTFSSAHGFLNGDKIVIVDSKSTPSIDGAYEVEYVSSTELKIYPNKVITGSAISPVFKFINAIDSERSTNYYKKNIIYYSKSYQPEAVPQENYIQMGSEEKEILRIFPLRDSLFVFKEDGLYRVTADYIPPTPVLFDSSCVLNAPDSVSVSNNNVYCWTTQGIQYINESGSTLISRPIDTEVLKVSSTSYSNFKTATFGVGYESDNSYVVWTVKNINDAIATQAFRFSSVTGTWTKYQKINTCGIIKHADDKMYLGAGDVPFIEQERKQFAREDYADREYAFGVPVYSWLQNNKIALQSVDNINIGDAVIQEQGLTIYQFNSLLKKLDNDPVIKAYRAAQNPPNFTSYYTLVAKYGDDLRDKITALATKLDSDPAIAQNDFAVTIASLSGLSISSISYSSPLVIETISNHGLFSGRQVLISGVNSIPDINGVFTATVIDATKFSISKTLLDYTVSISDTVSTADNSITDLLACYNKIIEKLNTDTSLGYNNYLLITGNSKLEAIITAVDKTYKIITIDKSLDFVVGNITIYNAIPCSFTYAPSTMGDPLSFKHFSQATMMFANKAFTSASLSFATDLLPQFIDVEFNGDGSGTFGNDAFGTNFFGGGSNYIPFRTYIPQQCQRCRYLSVKFSHKTAREQFTTFGLTLTGRTISSRAYR